ncbi:DUF4012 domain-containing protein [bacterium]|nr:MAG: DUF4012 domain-containing protein [bacterium]
MKHSRLFAVLSILISLSIILFIPLVRLVKPYLPFTNYLLGINKPTSYLILLGNDAEMRANGGFAGSYTKLSLSTSVIPGLTRNLYKFPLKISSSLSFQDIYVPNGQLKGYVTPPAPIQEAFGHGTWELANADWEPDFPTAATTLRWFFEKGGEPDPDNLLILNLTTIKKVLDVVGSFTVPEFNATLTPDNLYLFLQGKVEMNFFPGSTQKKDVLTAVGLALKNKILSLPLNKKLKIAQILYLDLKNQNIVINSTNEAFQNLLIKENFAGKLSFSTLDTYLLVETNLGANKANAYVTRHTTHTISNLRGLSSQAIHHQVTVKFQNASIESGPNPPFHYGGDYLAYLRFYIPSNAESINITRISASPKESPCQVPLRGDSLLDKCNQSITPNISQKFSLTELGFWQTTSAQGQTSISLSYTLPISPQNYSLTILKQHGLVSSPQTITIGTKTFSTPLTNDYIFP